MPWAWSTFEDLLVAIRVWVRRQSRAPLLLAVAAGLHIGDRERLCRLRDRRRILWLLIASALVVGCGSSTTPSPMPLSIWNGTTIRVTLVVNNSVIETVAPGSTEDPVKATLPPLPWSVETRSPSGRVLSRMAVNVGDVVYTTPDADGRSTAKGDGVRVDLSCGRLDVWSGPPLVGPLFSPGPPGDCD